MAVQAEQVDVEIKKSVEKSIDPYLGFWYVNWRGHDHFYVIEPDMRPELRLHLKNDDEHVPVWHLSGNVITRDGDRREGMGDNRRRSFELVNCRSLRQVQRGDETSAYSRAI